MEQYVATGRFPESRDLESSDMNPDVKGQRRGFIETEVRQAHWWDFLQIFSLLAVLGLVANLLARAWNVAWYGKASG